MPGQTLCPLPAKLGLKSSLHFSGQGTTQLLAPLPLVLRTWQRSQHKNHSIARLEAESCSECGNPAKIRLTCCRQYWLRSQCWQRWAASQPITDVQILLTAGSSTLPIDACLRSYQE
jgi:hypothetical protein